MYRAPFLWGLSTSQLMEPHPYDQLTVQNVLQIVSDKLSTGGTLVLGHITMGTLVSEPGFETPINATMSHTNDWPTIDPSGLHSGSTPALVSSA